jgi:glyoxylase-like metal-dependent hydrolase (beta-lactamase superfamily II)
MIARGTRVTLMQAVRRFGGAVQSAVAALAILSGQAAAQDSVRFRAFTPTTEKTLYPLQELAAGVFAVLGDSGKGAEGRPNAGFVITNQGIVAVGGLASPAQARAVIRTMRTRSRAQVRYLVLYAHHPDMMFGAIEFKRLGAKIVAHPDTRVLAIEAGPDQLVADWDGVVGLQELLGFEYANRPDRPVTGRDTLRLGGREIILIHPGAAHSAGDLMLWLPKERVLFAGDLLLEDGVTMVVDGNSATMLKALDLIDSLNPRVVVPGHGRLPADPRRLTAKTRAYLTTLRDSMQLAVQRGTPQRRAMEWLPPADATRPVSLPSRLRRNASQVYREMERASLGFEEETP